MSEGYVYMIHLENKKFLNMDVYKIGRTTNPRKRLQKIMHDYKTPAKFVAIAKVINFESCEYEILEKYSKFKYIEIKRYDGSKCNELVLLSSDISKEATNYINSLNDKQCDIEMYINMFNGECYKNLGLFLSRLSEEDRNIIQSPNVTISEQLKEAVNGDLS